MSGVFVTGGTSGIGRAVVTRLAGEGRRVVFAGRDAERGAAVEAATGATFLQVDLADRAACDHAISRADERLDGLDAFVSCAALIFRSGLAVTPEGVLRELVEVNLTAAFRFSRRVFEVMRADGGGVMVQVVSDSGIRGLHNLGAYSVTKAGLLTMSELFAAAGAPHRVRSVAVCPGATYPGMQSTATGYPDHAEDDSTWPPPLAGRHGSGADVAAAVAWLLSADASRVSGAVLRVDGGVGSTMLDRRV